MKNSMSSEAVTVTVLAPASQSTNTTALSSVTVNHTSEGQNLGGLLASDIRERCAVLLGPTKQHVYTSVWLIVFIIPLFVHNFYPIPRAQKPDPYS